MASARPGYGRVEAGSRIDTRLEEQLGPDEEAGIAAITASELLFTFTS